MQRCMFIQVLCATALCAIAGCGTGTTTSTGTGTGTSTGTSTSASNGTGAGSWVRNGADACERYLTADVLATVLAKPTGKSKVLSPQSCSYETADSGGSISIVLAEAGPAAFDAYQKYLVDPVPLPGVGDKASQSMIGIVAVKGNDRNCSIDAGGAPGSLKLHGAELGQKLGAICNQLFALP